MPTRPTRFRRACLATLILLSTATLSYGQIVDIQVRFVTVENPFFNDIGLQFEIPLEQQVQIEAEIVTVRTGTFLGFALGGDFGSPEVVRLDSISSDPPGVLLCDMDPASTFYGCSGVTTDPPDTMHAIFEITGVGIGDVLATTNVFTPNDPDTTNNTDTTTVAVGEQTNLARISGAVYLDPIGYDEPLFAIDLLTTRPMTGVVIDLLDEGGTLLERDTTTTGGYSFDVQPGMYQVRQHVPDGTYRVFPFNPDMHVVSAEAGVHTFNVDFLNTPLIKVTGRKLHDVDRNLLKKDPNDVGLNGWTIRLEGRTILGEPISLEMTTAGIDVDGDRVPDQGAYEFRVPPGRYEIDEVVQAGFERTRGSPHLSFSGQRNPPPLSPGIPGPRFFLFIFDRDDDPWNEATPNPSRLSDDTGKDFINWSIQSEDISVSEGGPELEEAIRDCNANQTEPPCSIDIEEVILKTSSGQDGVIMLQNPLPTITAPMIINGRGATLDGSLLNGASGFVVSGVGAVIRGFNVTNFDTDGIGVEGGGRVQVDSSAFVNNGGSGIRVSEGASASAAATSFFGNGGLAIDLGEPGPTPNNDDEEDGIPNAPTVTSVEAGDTLFVNVSYQGRDTSNVRFEVFTSSACGADGTGQGEFLMGGFNTETDSTGQIDMVLAVDTTFAPKRFVSLTATDAEGHTSEFSPCDESVATRVEDDVSGRDEVQPSSVRMLGTYPNPFNDRASIHFEVGEAQPVRIDVFDVLGRVVVAVTNEMKSAGRHTVHFRTEHLPAGVYVARMASEGLTMTRKMIRVR